MPDYLVMALAQACSARIGLLEGGTIEGGTSPDKSRRRKAAKGERGTGGKQEERSGKRNLLLLPWPPWID